VPNRLAAASFAHSNGVSQDAGIAA
jgi:hypothetical protein